MPRAPAFLADRLASLAPRERRFLLIGAAVVLLFILYLLLRPDETETELTPEVVADETQSVMAPPAQSVMPPPTAAPEAAPAPAAPPPSLQGLILYGVFGGGPGGGAAVVGTEGRQRLVRVGRDVLPGARLKEVGLGYAVIETSTGDVRLEFNKGARPDEPAAAPAAPSAEPATAPSPDPEQRKVERLEFRTGLEPHKVDGRTTGFAVRPGARMPLLQRAGLRPGDVIVAVNGQPFQSEEKVMELSEELASSYTADIDFLRGGKPMKASLVVNQR